jgi:hypothetical protein
MFNIKKRMRDYIVGVVLGLLAGAVLYFVQPVQWKGQALVRIGQISQNQNQNQNQNIYSIEPLPTLVERLKSRSFVLAVAKRAKNSEIGELLDIDKRSGLTVKPVKNSDSLIITVIGGSAELVQDSIDSVVAELISKHDAILDAYQADIRKELSRLDFEIDVLSKRLATILDSNVVDRGKSVEERNFAFGFEVIELQHNLDYKLNRASVLRESISSANIRPTSLIEPTFVSEKRVFSKLWRACLFGTLSGVFLSVLWVRWKK